MFFNPVFIAIILLIVGLFLAKVWSKNYKFHIALIIFALVLNISQRIRKNETQPPDKNHL